MRNETVSVNIRRYYIDSLRWAPLEERCRRILAGLHGPDVLFPMVVDENIDGRGQQKSDKQKSGKQKGGKQRGNRQRAIEGQLIDRRAIGRLGLLDSTVQSMTHDAQSIANDEVRDWMDDDELVLRQAMTTDMNEILRS
jgi:hypothetical protein